MKLEGKSQVLRIYIGSADKHHHQPTYEFIVFEAKKFGLAGASAFKGVLSFGASSMVHTAKIWELSADLPVVIEIIDQKEKIMAFIDHLDKLLEEEGDFGGLMTTYEVDVIAYKAHEKKI
jgi:PII-like signaling protein